MSSWSSLNNFPCTDLEPTFCEVEAFLTSRQHAAALEILVSLPSIPNVTQSSSSICKPSKPLASSAKSAFLSPKNDSRQIRKAFFTWFDEGFPSALTDLSSSSSLVGFFSRTSLKLYNILCSFHRSFNPHLMMSGPEMIKEFSPVPDWSRSPIRSLCYHPQTTKVAVALSDDSVHVYGIRLPVNPVLKHKLQKSVSCMAWKPYSASELAVGCDSGVMIWTLDPASVVARPSASCVSLLKVDGHSPVNSIEYDPQGKFLLTASAADTSMMLWNTSVEANVPLRRLGGCGVTLVAWSPCGRRVFTATPTSVFRLWSVKDHWTPEKWDIKKGHVTNACWSPCGNYLLFATSEEPQLFSLSIGYSAVPIVDLTPIACTLAEDGREVMAGGIVQAMSWDKRGERFAISFKNSDLIATFCTTIIPSLTLTPIGFIRGQLDESPKYFQFQKDFNKAGSLLTVVWSTGRVQHIPMLYTILEPNLNASLAAEASVSPDFKPELFSSPLLSQ